MKRKDYLDRVHDLQCTIRMNVHYYRELSGRCADSDRGTRIAVGVLAVSLLAVCRTVGRPAVPDVVSDGLTPLAIAIATCLHESLAITAVVLAAKLNVSRSIDESRQHRVLLRCWQDVQREIEVESVRVGTGEDGTVEPCRVERLLDIIARVEGLQAEESSTDLDLLAECHESALEELGYADDEDEDEDEPVQTSALETDCRRRDSDPQ